MNEMIRETGKCSSLWGDHIGGHVGSSGSGLKLRMGRERKRLVQHEGLESREQLCWPVVKKAVM